MDADGRQQRGDVDCDVAAGIVMFRGWQLDLAGRALTSSAGCDVHLTPAEFKLLAALARRPGHVLSRDQLLDAVAGRASAPFDRTIDVLIGRLRKKIEVNPRSPSLIITVPEVGYKLVVHADWPGSRALSAPALGRGPYQCTAVAVLPFVSEELDCVQRALAADLPADLAGDLVRRSARQFVAGSVANQRAASESGWSGLGQQLGVRYLISGSVRRLNSTLQIGAHLIDATTAKHLWSERASVVLDDRADGYELVVRQIAVALDRQLDIAEGLRAELEDGADCATLLARGRAICARSHSRATALAALRFYRKALTLDRRSVDAMAELGERIILNIINSWSGKEARDIRCAETLLRQALEPPPTIFRRLAGWAFCCVGKGTLRTRSSSCAERTTSVRILKQLASSANHFCFRVDRTLGCVGPNRRVPSPRLQTYRLGHWVSATSPLG
jgi:TolB-like protein